MQNSKELIRFNKSGISQEINGLDKKHNYDRIRKQWNINYSKNGFGMLIYAMDKVL